MRTLRSRVLERHWQYNSMVPTCRRAHGAGLWGFVRVPVGYKLYEGLAKGGAVAQVTPKAIAVQATTLKRATE